MLHHFPAGPFPSPSHGKVWQKHLPNRFWNDICSPACVTLFPLCFHLFTVITLAIYSPEILFVPEAQKSATFHAVNLSACSLFQNRDHIKFHKTTQILKFQHTPHSIDTELTVLTGNSRNWIQTQSHSRVGERNVYMHTYFEINVCYKQYFHWNKFSTIPFFSPQSDEKLKRDGVW